jgi:integrase
MATIRERPKGDGTRAFHVQVRMAGYPARTASFSSKRQAERWAKTVEAEMIEGRHFRSAEARRRTLAEAIDRYLEHEAPKLRDGRMQRSTLPWWREKLGRFKLCDITPALIAQYRDQLAAETYRRARPGARRSLLKAGQQAREFKRKPNTINNYLVSLGRIFSVARREWHWITHNPMEGVAKLSAGPGRVRYLSEDERQRLLTETAKDPQLHVLVVMALSTAARAGELTNLSWHDVDLKEGRILLRKTKNMQPRVVWVHGEALRLLKEHGRIRRLDDAPVFLGATPGSRYGYHTPFKAACAAADVRDFRFHDLRHSAATYLAREGATEQQLRTIGGWKSNVVSRYVHLAAEDAKAVLERMNAKILRNGAAGTEADHDR